MLKYLNGLNQQNNNYMNEYEMTELGKIKLPKIKLPTKVTQTIKNVGTQIKQTGSNIKDAVKKVNIATVPLAPARTAFLQFVKNNSSQVADKLAEAYQKNPSKVQDFWKKLGGDFNALKSAINQGTKNKISGEADGTAKGSNLDDAVKVAGILTPILTLVIKLLTDLGIRKDKLAEAEANGKKQLSENPDLTTEGVNLPQDSNVLLSRPSGSETTETTGKNMLPIIIGAGALGVFLLMRKK